MRGTVSLVAGLALVLPGPAVPAIAAGQGETGRGIGYCRQPEALPDLPPERKLQRRAADDRSGTLSRLPSAPPPPPPPLAAPPASAGEDGGGPIMVTGSRVSRSDYAAASPVVTADEALLESSSSSEVSRLPDEPAPGSRPRQPQPQSGLLTAGEHDDLLNPELYADYVRRGDVGQGVKDLPQVDTARLLTVEVRDSQGHPVPFAPVEVRCSDGNSLTLRTMADGKAVFFPALDRLSPEIEVRVGGETRRADLADRRGSTSIGFTLAPASTAVRKLDLALVVDVTGSMGDELRYLQAELKSILASIERRHPEVDIRVGFSFYRDQEDDFVTATAALSGDLGAGQALLAAQRADGGGDYEEAMQEALVRAAGFAWRDDAVKTLLLVGDAPPHDADFPLAWLAAEHLRASRVHIVPVGASGVADKAEFLMRAMAAATQSRYTFLTDDSGIGNAHAEPAIDCYLVTRLDALLRRIVDSQLSGRRIEPDANEVIRTVGTYDDGKCVLPRDFGRDRD